MEDVLSMQSSNQKGNQQPRRNRKKGKNNNRKGGNKNENANNNDKNGRNAGGTSKRNVRLNYLARFVRKFTSLTCALGLMKLRDS